MKYRVYGEYIARINVDIDASSEQEAENIARNIFDYADREEFEIGEEISIDVDTINSTPHQIND